MNERIADHSRLPTSRPMPNPLGALRGAASGAPHERTYFRAKQYFDFCQWVILSTAFAGISLYFLHHPVYALQYAACVIAAVTVTMLAFWHLILMLHVNVVAMIKNRLLVRTGRADATTVQPIAILLDAVILIGFIHMLNVFSSSLLARMEILPS